MKMENTAERVQTGYQDATVVHNRPYEASIVHPQPYPPLIIK